MADLAAPAQEISGYSTVGTVNVCTGWFGCGFNKTYQAEVSAYVDTEEDYTASLYYDVSSDSALYYEGSPSALTSGSVTGNPSASGSYTSSGGVLPNTGSTCYESLALPPYQGSTTYCSNITPGLYTEATDHVVDFFYVTSLGEYYDPYGFSQASGGGGYDSDFWFNLDVWGTYLAEASVVLGETYDSSSNNTNSNLQGPVTDSALFQSFIPPDYVDGPGITQCTPDIYAGDNRGFNPALGSYRAMQGVTVGIGGYTGA